MQKILLYITGCVALVVGLFFIFITTPETKISGTEDEEYTLYESDADEPADCSSYESFDAERSVCYFECTDENSCREIQTSIDDELSSWADETEERKKPVAEDSKDTSAPIVEYAVSRGEELTLKSGENSSEYHALWDEVAEISPDSLSDSYVETFAIFNDPESDTLAYVEDADDNGKWTIALNKGNWSSMSPREQKSTLIHELAHIISLNTTQIEPQTSCAYLLLDEGCSDSEAYLTHFWENFWKDKDNTIYDESRFITEYAQTDIVEDFAETFAFFVIDKNKEKLGDEEKYVKIKMLYEFPELVSMRNDMRQTLGRDIVRARKKNSN